MFHSDQTPADAFWNTRDGNIAVVPTKEGRLWMFRRGNLTDSIWYFSGDPDSQLEIPTSGKALDGNRFIHTCIKLGFIMRLQAELFVPTVSLYDARGIHEWLDAHCIKKVPTKEELKAVLPVHQSPSQ